MSIARTSLLLALATLRDPVNVSTMMSPNSTSAMRSLGSSTRWEVVVASFGIGVESRLADPVAHPLRERRGVLEIAAREEHQELVRSEARHRVRAPHDGADAVGDLQQHGVADAFAIFLDHGVERIDLAEDDADAFPLPARAVELAIEQLEHRVAVPELRAGIDQRALAQTLALLDELRLRAAERDELQLRLDQPREIAQQDEVAFGEGATTSAPA